MYAEYAILRLSSSTPATPFKSFPVTMCTCESENLTSEHLDTASLSATGGILLMRHNHPFSAVVDFIFSSFLASFVSL